MESLDAFPGEDYESDIGSYLADSGIDVEEIVISRNMKEDLEKAIDGVLDEREADILRMRWGADGTQEMKSLEEVGRKYNLTRERIRQIEKKAFTNSEIRHLSI